MNIYLFKAKKNESRYPSSIFRIILAKDETRAAKILEIAVKEASRNPDGDFVKDYFLVNTIPLITDSHYLADILCCEVEPGFLAQKTYLSFDAKRP